jgi:hypothetical protein
VVTGPGPGPAADDGYEQVLALLGFGAEDLLAAFGWRRATGYLDNVFVAVDQARHHGEFRLPRQAAVAAGQAEWAAFWDRLSSPPSRPTDGAADELLRLADQAIFGDPREWLPRVHAAVARYLDVPPDTPDTYLLSALVLLRGSLQPG